MARGDSQIVAFFGHGNRDTLGQPALIDRANINRATGIVVAVACWSALELGPTAKAMGVESYVGFTDEIHVVESEVIDRLVCEGFEGLLSGEESPQAFEEKFKAACEAVQLKYLRISRDDDAHAIGAAAQIFKMALKVL